MLRAVISCRGLNKNYTAIHYPNVLNGGPVNGSVTAYVCKRSEPERTWNEREEKQYEYDCNGIGRELDFKKSNLIKR